MQKILIALFLISSKVIVAQLYAPSTTLVNTTNTASGNVGIGVSGPIRRLEVNEVGDNVNFTNVLRLSQANTGNPQSGSGVAMEFAIGNFYNPVIPAGRIAVINTYYNQRARMVFATKSADNTLTDQMVIESNGNVGIGTTSPAAKLDVGVFIPNGTLGSVLGRLQEGNTIGSGTYLGIKGYGTQTTDYGGKAFALEHSFYGVTNNSISFHRGSSEYGGFMTFNTHANIERVRINGDGNVGIGTTTPDSKLAVNGTIHSKEVKVDMNNWPDYVFEPTYTLPSLDSVQSYINLNKHLPEVPSAREMEANGVNLGEMNMLLLKKVEELTLYQIESNKRVERLQQQIDDLKKLKK